MIIYERPQNFVQTERRKKARTILFCTCVVPYGVTVNVLVLVTLSDVAEMVTTVEVITFAVMIVNVPEICPPETVILAGTLATEGLLLIRVTGNPAEQAGYETDTAAMRLFPPFTVLLNDKLATGGGVTVSDALFVESPDVAVIVTAALVHCGTVVTGTTKPWLPAGTVTRLGTDATAVLLLLMPTGQLEGATSPKVMLAVSLALPGTVVGNRVRFCRAGFRVRVVFALAPLSDAVMVTVVIDETEEDLMVKFIWLCPCGALTFDGTLTAILSVFRETTVPPTGVSALRTTSPVA